MGKASRNKQRRFIQEQGRGLKITGTGIQYESSSAAKGLTDPGKGEHYWTMTAVWWVKDPEAATDKSGPPQHMDMENLLDVAGPGCFKCGELYSKELASKPCKGSVHE